ncbi:MAG: 3-oxoacyl-[acyl-carrier-protein] synthase III C-terminal domain-containing protein, partial [Candidatus Marinimicrobia bacterium]|nr:3-oxoacyl-[acyl-carrier-protein] synthase III C-terminal domain-containing protein [Candidatus Neomarinimicrobiota bacterium]
AKFIESGQYERVMVIGVDTMSTIMDYTDRNICVLFGDGGGGAILESTSTEKGIIDSILRIDGSGADYLIMPGGGSRQPATVKSIKSRQHYLKQDGKTVYKFAVKGMADVSNDILTRNNLTGDDISLFIPHQANKRIIDATAKRCGLSEDKVLINIGKYGNTTAGTIPLALSEAVDDGRLNNGNILLLAAFGAGFTWGSMLIKWDTRP